jgi:hypothetical protein
VGVIVAIRIGMMFVPGLRHGTSKSESTKTPDFLGPVQQTVNIAASPLTPYKEELIAEWWGLVKFLRIYDREKEEGNLMAYRKLRGWE